MTAKELIQWLTSAIAEHGDLEVGCMYHEYGENQVAAFEVVNADPKYDDRELGEKFIRVS